MPKSFTALVVDEAKDGTYKRALKEKKLANLPDDDVLVEVHYTALNYKDALSATGHKGVTQQYPHTPGIDASGVVAKSNDPRFSDGDQVIVTSFDLGQNRSGGFGEYISVPGDWVVPLPDGLTLRESMILGTAGFTAAYGVYQLIHNNTKPERDTVLVTGATGGVGSLAIALLAKNNFDVIAATGKTDRTDYLKSLGAAQIIDREDIYDESDKPLLSGRWHAAYDTIGGEMLDAILRQIKHNGTVACCGNILGEKLETSIYPFILRGISLMGVDSGRCAMPMRISLWRRLASDWKLSNLDQIARECSMEDLNKEIDKILEGGQVGKVLIKVAG